MLFVVACLLFVVCWCYLLLVASYSLCVVCRLLLCVDSCCSSFVARCRSLLFVLFVAFFCCLLLFGLACVFRCLSFVVCRSSFVVCRLSFAVFGG